MTKHPYASTSRRESTVYRWLGISAVVSALLTHSALTQLATAYPQFGAFIAEYRWLIEPISMVSYFELYLAMFNRWLWKKFLKTPNLTGLWIGATLPNYQDWPHVAVMKVEQSWSTISASIHVYCKKHKNDDWNTALEVLGIDHSVDVSFSEVTNDEVDIIMNYQHQGKRRRSKKEDGSIIPNQPDFDGTIVLNAELTENGAMHGTIFTNRYNEEEKSFGTFGVLEFRPYATSRRAAKDICLEAIGTGLIGDIEKVLVETVAQKTLEAAAVVEAGKMAQLPANTAEAVPGAEKSLSLN